jgi:hypothetical protein
LLGQQDAPPPPALCLRQAVGLLEFTWFLWNMNANLQTTSDLTPPVTWLPQPAMPVLTNGLWRAVLPVSDDGGRFHRLRTL